jgi:hypothetical protein
MLFKTIYTLFMAAGITSVTGTACQSTATTATTSRTDCVDTLKKAITDAPSFFVKVHAGENLVANGYTDNIESTFLELRAANPDKATGAIRVLAKLYKDTQPDKWQECINLITDKYRLPDSTHPRLVALESLGKLGYGNPLPEILQDAQTGQDGFRAMARWVLSNLGTQAGEDSLAALLAYPDAVDFRGAAYAFRFKKSVSDSTLHLLEQCAERLPATDPARVYVLSALYVHTPAGKDSAVKAQLLQYLNGAVPAKYETAEALSLKGGAEDLPVLETLLHDADNDVRVAAANAILKIEKRTTAASPSGDTAGK